MIFFRNKFKKYFSNFRKLENLGLKLRQYMFIWLFQLISSLFIFDHFLSIYKGWAPGLRRGGAEAPAQWEAPNNNLNFFFGHFAEARVIERAVAVGSGSSRLNSVYRVIEVVVDETRRMRCYEFCPFKDKAVYTCIYSNIYIYIYKYSKCIK